MKEYRGIRVSAERGVCRITLSRPPHNILDAGTLEEILDAIRSAGAGPELRAIVFAAEGKSFSAGVEVADHLPEKVRETLRTFHAIFEALEQVGTPTVAQVEGAALGGGCELAVACDWVYATSNARLGVPEINLAVFPPVAAALFPALIGYRNTADLVLTGRLLQAEEARAMGLVSRVCEPETIAEDVEKLLSVLREKSAAALRVARRALRKSVPWGSAQALTIAERIYLQELTAVPDMLEGLRAFIEKRKPTWST